MLEENKIRVIPVLNTVVLSPSFYSPSNLLRLNNMEFTNLAAQFVSTKAWFVLPDYAQRCQEYFEEPRQKAEYLMYTKSLLERGCVDAARDLLEKTVKYQWPETLK